MGVGVIVVLPITIKGTAAEGKVTFDGMVVVSEAEADAGTDCYVTHVSKEGTESANLVNLGRRGNQNAYAVQHKTSHVIRTGFEVSETYRSYCQSSQCGSKRHI